jgi:serine/threonine protein kinase
MELHALQPGYMLAEYRIEKLLGEGGFGLTYLAFDTHLDKNVAIKEYMPSDFAWRQDSTTIVPKSEAAKTDYEWGLNAFINEAKTLAKFDDTNIVRIYRFFKENGTAYLVMEYCEGGCLSARYSQSNTMSEMQVRELLSPIMNGLQLVHDGGVLHRDIKPDNMMFRADGTPVLIDFGAARQQVVSKSKPITALLTPGYAPIEQYGSKADRLGPWTDIYSLAAVAYSCLTGKVPPDASDRVIEDEMETLAQSSNASKFLKSLDNALSIQASSRPQSLTDWYAEWEDASQGSVKPAPKPEFAVDDTKQLDDVIELVGGDVVIAGKKSSFANSIHMKHEDAVPFSFNYIEVEKFAAIKFLTADKAIKMIREGFYQGQLKDDKWYVHRIELGGDSKQIKSITQPLEYVPILEFAEFKGITPGKAIEMIRDGFYQGRLIEGEWFALYSEISPSNSTQKHNNYYPLPACAEFIGLLGFCLYIALMNGV